VPSLRALSFWSSTGGAAWVLLGYPAVLRLLPSRPWRRGEDRPAVTIVVPAYREFDLLPRKLASLRALDYPADRLQVVVAIDGDEALAELARTSDPLAVVRLVPERSGKPTALNVGLEDAHGEIVVFTDAHNPLDRGALLAAMQHFADPAITGVTGSWAEVGSVYSRYEDVIRRWESRSGSVAGVFGGFFALRRSAVPTFPPDVVNEDLWLLFHCVRGGGRVIYEPAASSSEPMLAAANEAERRARISAGRMMLRTAARGLPRAFQWRLASHKFGRLALPYLLLGMLVSSLSLSQRPSYRLAAGGQAVAYAIGALDVLGVRLRGMPPSMTRAAGQFTLGNIAVARGAVRGLRGRQTVIWRAVR
jgi:cellulose synthase/poly-beta-1,6-N-acetylglucosamine synthase-like glycosyltransferase